MFLQQLIESFHRIGTGLMISQAFLQFPMLYGRANHGDWVTERLGNTDIRASNCRRLVRNALVRQNKPSKHYHGVDDDLLTTPLKCAVNYAKETEQRAARLQHRRSENVVLADREVRHGEWRSPENPASNMVSPLASVRSSATLFIQAL